MMTALYLIASVLPALGFYLASAHQRPWPSLRRHARMLRGFALLALVATVAGAIADLGTWPGVFAALTTWMLALVLLPYFDAWWKQHRGRRHVG